jgi:hypothetical protein
MLMVLLLRFAFQKEEKGPDSLLDDGYIFYDRSTTTASVDFAGYTFFNNNTNWFSYCINREDTPDRTIIALAPTGNTVINAIKVRLEADFLTYNHTFTVVTYTSRDEIMEIIGADTYEKDGTAGICFGAAFSEATTNKYTVNMIFDDLIVERQSGSNMPNQDLPAADDFQRGPNNEAFNQYKRGGYTYLQNIIANEILLAQTSVASAYISMVYTGMKTNEYIKDDFAETADNLWSYTMLIIFLAPMYRFLFNSVLEKETKIREAMKIMGLTDLPYWLSWASYYILINTIQCILMMIILIPVFEFSNMFLIFLYLWLFGLSLFGYSIFITSFFSTAKTSAIVGTMVFFVQAFLFRLVEDRQVSAGLKSV